MLLYYILYIVADNFCLGKWRFFGGLFPDTYKHLLRQNKIGKHLLRQNAKIRLLIFNAL